jgi:hypothetical protein
MPAPSTAQRLAQAVRDKQVRFTITPIIDLSNVEAAIFDQIADAVLEKLVQRGDVKVKKKRKA